MPSRLRCAIMLLLLTPILVVPMMPLSTAQEAEEPEKADAQENQEAPKQEFSRTFWTWLTDVDYRKSFTIFPEGSEGEFQPGQAPHGEKLRVYINSPARESWDNPDRNAVIVKENYNADEELQSITVMYRTREGYDPANKDWYWAKYSPDGTVADMEGTKLAGKVEGCIACHKGAGGEDYLFINDADADDTDGNDATPEKKPDDAASDDAASDDDSTDDDSPDDDSPDDAASDDDSPESEDADPGQ